VRPPDIERVRRDVFRLFDALEGERESAGVFPLLNVTQDADNFYVRAELPGVAASDLKVTTEKNQLTIKGARTFEREKDGVSYHRREREEGTFSRSVALPGPFDAERTSAHYVDGVLTVVLPKAEESKPRNITVKTS
jgi:HSP20 family protein